MLRGELKTARDDLKKAKHQIDSVVNVQKAAKLSDERAQEAERKVLDLREQLQGAQKKLDEQVGR